MTLATDVPIGCYFTFQTRGFLGWVVRKATGSPYDHAALALGNGDLIESSSPHGVRLGHVSAYEGCLTSANVDETMTTRERAAAVAKARWFLAHQDEYAWDDIAAIGLQDLGIHWRVILRLLRCKHALICSQMTAICGAAAGLDWRCGRPNTAYVTPADLARRPQVRVVEN